MDAEKFEIKAAGRSCKPKGRFICLSGSVHERAGLTPDKEHCSTGYERAPRSHQGPNNKPEVVEILLCGCDIDAPPEAHYHSHYVRSSNCSEIYLEPVIGFREKNNTSTDRKVPGAIASTGDIYKYFLVAISGWGVPARNRRQVA